MKRYWWIAIPAAIIAGLIVWRYSQNQQTHKQQVQAAAMRKNAPPEVRTAPAVVRDIEHTFVGIAGVQAPQAVSIAPKVTGLLTYLTLREGARVTSGEVLAKLDPTEALAALSQEQAAINSAHANLVDARTKYKRTYWLYKQGFEAAQDVDDAKANVQVQQAALSAAQAGSSNVRAQISDLILRSPVNGYVTARYMDPGSVVSAGQAVLIVQTVRELFVTTTAPEGTPGIEVGDTARATFDGLPGRVFTGTVTHVDPAADPNSHEFLIRAQFANARDIIRPGMYGTLTVVTAVTRRAVIVPREAIQQAANGPTVTVVDSSSVAHIGPVRTGDSDVVGVQITQGVQPGQQVVVLTYAPVKDGQKVKVENAGAPYNLAGEPTVIAGGNSAGVPAATAAGGAAAPTYGSTPATGGAATSGAAPAPGSFTGPTTSTTGAATGATSIGTAATGTTAATPGVATPTGPTITAPQAFTGAPGNFGGAAAAGTGGYGASTQGGGPGAAATGTTGAGGAAAGGVGAGAGAAGSGAGR